MVSIKEGAWFTPDASGQDTRGCSNVLIADRASPAGAAPFNTCFVDVAGAERELSTALRSHVTLTAQACLQSPACSKAWAAR